MTKLIYPQSGLSSFQTSLDSAYSSISRANGLTNLDIPIGIECSSYLNSLASVIEDYLREITSMRSRLNESCANYNRLNDTLNSDNLVVNSCAKRDRMII